MTQIKFCGLRREEDVKAVNNLKPDYVGFVFFEGSKRFVSPETAKKLSVMLSDVIVPVGVFLDKPLDDIIKICKAGTIKMIQLHGHESEDYVKAAKEKSSLPIIRAFTVKNEEDVKKACETSADYLMLDSGAGTGNMFDWSLLRNVNRPYFLAGGLNPENVENAIKQLHPFAVDTSSGIETDGFKDSAKMQKFMEAVRNTV